MAEAEGEKEARVSNRELLSAINRLSDSINKLMVLFRDANASMRQELEGSNVKELGQKLDTLIMHNEDIAKGVLALLDVNEKHLPRITYESKRVVARPVSRPMHLMRPVTQSPQPAPRLLPRPQSPQPLSGWSNPQERPQSYNNPEQPQRPLQLPLPELDYIEPEPAQLGAEPEFGAPPEDEGEPKTGFRRLFRKK